jgi:hypothetical protein
MPNTFTDVPIDSHTLAQDQDPMRQNFGYIPGALGKDHQIVFGDSDTGTPFEGRHMQVSLNNRHGAVPTVAGIGDETNSLIYSDNGNLIFGSALGAGAFQLTTYNAAANFGGNATITIGGFTINNAGWTFLPGGLILMYANSLVLSNPSVTTIPFPFTFPNNVFAITFGLSYSGGNNPGANNVYIKSGSINQSNFQVVSSASGGSFTPVYYMAIGN